VGELAQRHGITNKPTNCFIKCITKKIIELSPKTGIRLVFVIQSQDVVHIM